VDGVPHDTVSSGMGSRWSSASSRGGESRLEVLQVAAASGDVGASDFLRDGASQGCLEVRQRGRGRKEA
jgi:hypothetical protein